MGLTAMWTHGHDALTETENVQIGSIGWGALIQAPQNSFETEWIHYNIPTPVILNDVRPKILRVMILFDTFNRGPVNSGAITSVHVWDRDNRILQIDGLALTGSHLNLDVENRFEFPANVTPFFGVGVSIGYHFDPAHRNGTLLITSVGADFQF